MKLKTFAAALAATTIAGSAFAADLPSRKVAPAYIAPAPIMTWTGFYIGLNAGYGWAGSNGVALPSFDTGAGGFTVGQARGAIPMGVSLNNGGGFVGGGQIGFNYQFGALVAGLEADIQALTGHSRSASYAGAAPTFLPSFGAFNSKLDYLATLRGRLGFAVSPSMLLYATGGLAFGEAKLSAVYVGPAWGPPMATGASYSGTRLGWTAGAGVEWKFAQNWSAKLEYLYYDLGNIATGYAPYVYGASITGIDARTRVDGHIVRAGLNYHFNFGSAAPVVAKY